MDDVTIKCLDCGHEFTFSTKEQKFYEEKGFVPPKRCRYCRHIRADRRNKRERRIK